jgi:TPR repeat protein
MEQAGNGEARGQFCMGKRYLTGGGVKKDIAKARDMFQKAAAQGHPDAAAELKKLNRANPAPPPQP